MENKFGIGETVFYFNGYKPEIKEFEVTGIERDEKGIIRYAVENHHGEGSTPIKGEDLFASKEECLRHAADYCANKFKEDIQKLFGKNIKSKEFEGLKQLIEISNGKLIRDILLPQVRGLKDEDEKRQLMMLALQREREE